MSRGQSAVWDYGMRPCRITDGYPLRACPCVGAQLATAPPGQGSDVTLDRWTDGQRWMGTSHGYIRSDSKDEARARAACEPLWERLRTARCAVMVLSGEARQERARDPMSLADPPRH